MMKTMEYRNLITRYLSGELSSRDTDKLLEYLEKDPQADHLFYQLSDIWEMARSYPDHFTVNTPRAWEKVRGHIQLYELRQTDEGRKRSRLSRLFRWMATLVRRRK